jgi:hypothetical protein
MSDETTQFIVGDAAIDALGRPPKRRRFFRRKKQPPPLTQCENCGAALTGEYCAQCGQHAIDYRRSLLRVLLDAADSFLNWDTKFLNSVGVLLARPWRLTNDFNAGRRVRYVHPLRLYLLASIAFFLMARTMNLEPGGPIELSAEDRAELASQLGKLTGSDSILTPEQRQRVDAARAKLTQGDGALTDKEQEELKDAFGDFLQSNLRSAFKSEEREKLKAALKRIPEAPEPPAAAKPGEQPAEPLAHDIPPIPSPPRKDGFIIYDNPDGAKSPVGAWLERRVKEKVGADGTNTKLFLDTLRSNIPGMMLFCIPLFAFVLKVLYLRKGRFYVEHLVYALHIHTFAYIGVVLITLLAMGAGRWQPGLQAPLAVFLSCVLLVQVFRSIRRVYGEGWFFSTFKFLLGGIAYFVILIIAVGATAFVTLLLPS